MERLPPAGVWYEPRSFWSTQVLEGGTDRKFAVGKFDRSHFYNGTRWPAVIERVVFYGLNYAFDIADTAVAVPDSGNAVLNRTGNTIGVPFRQDYTKNRVTTASFCPKPTSEPSTLIPTGTGFGQGSGPLFGQSRLNFKHPLYIARTGSVEVELSSLDDFQLAGVDILANAGITEIPANISWFEEGGLFAGSARTHQFGVPVRELAGRPPPSSEGWPYPLPPGLLPTTTTNNVPFWAPTARFSATEFNRQEATRSGTTKVLGLSVALDQIDYAAALREPPFNGDGTPAPLAGRVGCGVKVTNGPSGDAWWRPGAPLAIVLDSITPAVVYDLIEPLTLGPGDVIDVEELVPGTEFIGEQAPLYQVSMSFNGYSAIEG